MGILLLDENKKNKTKGKKKINPLIPSHPLHFSPSGQALEALI